MLKYIITWDVWMHKDAIQNSQKAVLPKLVKSPIGAWSSFQIYEDAHEFSKSSGKDKEGWKDNSYMLLIGENEGGWCGQKNKAVTPSLAFPSALN